MRFLIIALLATLLTNSFYQWKYASYDFVGTQWHCSESKSGFTSEAYRHYEKVTEMTTIYFSSKDSVTYFQSGYLKHMDGVVEPYELVMTADNETIGSQLKQTFKSVDWNLKPERSPLYIRDKNSLVGFKSDLRYEVDGKQLYLFNQAGSEDVNIACRRS
jgi:hypothetical protein